MREWYLLQTKARQEGLAQDNLLRQGYRSWLPRLRVPRRRGARIEALFPGYLFVHLDPALDNFAPIRSTIGALRLVQFGNEHARVPDILLAELMAQSDADGVCERSVDSPQPGDRVDIVHGALRGYSALVHSLRGPDRVALLLDIAGRHVRVLASPDAIVRR